MLMFYCFSAAAVIVLSRPVSKSADFVGIWHSCHSGGRLHTVLRERDLHCILDFRCGRGLDRVFLDCGVGIFSDSI